MVCPPGVGKNSDAMIMLKNILYGQSEAPRFWSEKLNAGLEDLNFDPSESDVCMFISDNIVCLVQVNNFLWFAKESKDIHEVIK